MRTDGIEPTPQSHELRADAYERLARRLFAMWEMGAGEEAAKTDELGAVSFKALVAVYFSSHGHATDPVSVMMTYRDVDVLAHELVLYSCSQWCDDVMDGWAFRLMEECLKSLLGLLLDYFPRNDKSMAGLASLIGMEEGGHLDFIISEILTGYVRDGECGHRLSMRVRNTDRVVPSRHLRLEADTMPRLGLMDDEDYTISHYVTYRGLSCVLDVAPRPIGDVDPIKAYLRPLAHLIDQMCKEES